MEQIKSIEAARARDQNMRDEVISNFKNQVVNLEIVDTKATRTTGRTTAATTTRPKSFPTTTISSKFTDLETKEINSILQGAPPPQQYPAPPHQQAPTPANNPPPNSSGKLTLISM